MEHGKMYASGDVGLALRIRLSPEVQVQAILSGLSVLMEERIG
jgi:hypothetical protein